MFIGHYGVAFAVKKVDNRIPLWLLFVAVQFVDVIWAPLTLLGIEKAQVTTAYRGSLPLDLYYMPYTHSLPAAIAWSLLAYGVCRVFATNRTSVLIAIAVFSHWILDLLVHRPDLPLYDNAHKVGLGLWNYPIPALALEIAIYAGGLWLYLRATSAETFAGKYGLIILGAIILSIQVAVFWFPILPTTKVAAAVFLIGYVQLAAGSKWLEQKRMNLGGETDSPQ